MVTLLWRLLCVVFAIAALFALVFLVLVLLIVLWIAIDNMKEND